MAVIFVYDLIKTIPDGVQILCLHFRRAKSS